MYTKQGTLIKVNPISARNSTFWSVAHDHAENAVSYVDKLGFVSPCPYYLRLSKNVGNLLLIKPIFTTGNVDLAYHCSDKKNYYIITRINLGEPPLIVMLIILDRNGNATDVNLTGVIPDAGNMMRDGKYLYILVSPTIYVLEPRTWTIGDQITLPIYTYLGICSDKHGFWFNAYDDVTSHWMIVNTDKKGNINKVIDKGATLNYGIDTDGRVLYICR